MIRVTVEILPFGYEERKCVLGTAKIWNDCTGDRETGNYRYKLYRAGPDGKLERRAWKQGAVRDFPRMKRGAWDLLFRALRAAVAGRNEKR